MHVMCPCCHVSVRRGGAHLPSGVRRLVDSEVRGQILQQILDLVLLKKARDMDADQRTDK